MSGLAGNTSAPSAGGGGDGTATQGPAGSVAAPWWVRLSDGAAYVAVALDATVAAIRDRLPGALGPTGGLPVEGTGTPSPGNGMRSIAVEGVGIPGVTGGGSLSIQGSDPDQIPVIVSRAGRVARTMHLSSVTLPASPAWTNQDAYPIPDGVRAVSFITTYTRGAASGQPKFRVQVGNGVEENVDVSVIDPNITVSQPFGQQSMYALVLAGAIPPDGTPVSREMTIQVRAGWTSIRLIAAELGVPGTPGTLQIVLTAAH